jgi:hypothetical protein
VVLAEAKPEAEKKPKKKKKKKNKPPKNLNPQAKPDPDRWKPKHMRAGYRGKKKGSSLVSDSIFLSIFYLFSLFIRVISLCLFVELILSLPFC